MIEKQKKSDLKNYAITYRTYKEIDQGRKWNKDQLGLHDEDIVSETKDQYK